MVMLNVALVVPVSPSGMLPAPAMASVEVSLSVILPTPRPTPTQAPQLLVVLEVDPELLVGLVDRVVERLDADAVRRLPRAEDEEPGRLAVVEGRVRRRVLSADAARPVEPRRLLARLVERRLEDGERGIGGGLGHRDAVERDRRPVGPVGSGDVLVLDPGLRPRDRDGPIGRVEDLHREGLVVVLVGLVVDRRNGEGDRLGCRTRVRRELQGRVRERVDAGREGHLLDVVGARLGRDRDRVVVDVDVGGVREPRPLPSVRVTLKVTLAPSRTHTGLGAPTQTGGFWGVGTTPEIDRVASGGANTTAAGPPAPVTSRLAGPSVGRLAAAEAAAAPSARGAAAPEGAIKAAGPSASAQGSEFAW